MGAQSAPIFSYPSIPLKISNATCGTIAFPPAFIDSFLHLEKVIASNRAEIPSFPSQIGD